MASGKVLAKGEIIMKEKTIALEVQTNAFYSINGGCYDGSYYQYYRVIKRGKVVVIIDDTSCGGFGERFDVIIYKNGEYYDNAKWDYINRNFDKFSHKDSFSLYVDMNRIPVQKFYKYAEIEPAELKKIVLPERKPTKDEDDLDLQLFIERLMEE